MKTEKEKFLETYKKNERARRKSRIISMILILINFEVWGIKRYLIEEKFFIYITGGILFLGIMSNINILFGQDKIFRNRAIFNIGTLMICILISAIEWDKIFL